MQTRLSRRESALAPGDLFAATLAILRMIRRMSQSELAAAAGVTNSAISDYERGKVDPQAATLRKLLRTLDLPVSVLEETETFILRIRSQVGVRGGERSGTRATETAELTAVQADGRELWAEVTILAAEGGRFLSRLIRLFFLTCFWMAGARERGAAS